MQCSSLSNPVQVAPGVWFAEIQAAATEALKPGDVIAFAGRCFRGQRIARMVLHTQEPARGPFKIGTNFGGTTFSLYTNLMLMANAYFTDSRGGFLPSTTPWVDLEQNIDSVANLKHNASGKPVATCQILNPLPVELTVDYVCTVRGYYRKVLGQDRQQITVPAQTCVTREIPFDPTDDDPAYSVEATVKAVKSGQSEIRNPKSQVELLGWPEADTVEFFPFLRQTVPWVNPFEYRNLRRLVLTSPIAGPRPRTRAERAMGGRVDHLAGAADARARGHPVQDHECASELPHRQDGPAARRVRPPHGRIARRTPSARPGA